MSDFSENEPNANPFEERINPMSDYSTSTSENEARYQESTQQPLIPEVVDTGSEVDLADSNPFAAVAENFHEEHPLDSSETLFTEEEAHRLTEDIKVKVLHAAEAQYDLIQAAQRAFDGHVWIALGYAEGMEGWKAYCADNFTDKQIRLTGQARTDLIMGFDPNKISNRAIAALLGVSHQTVDRTVAKSGRSGKKNVRGADGKKRSLTSNPMSSKERQAEIVRLHEEGVKQTDIAEQLEVSQSTVSDTLRRDKERRMSDGLMEVTLTEPTEVADVPDGEAIDLDEGDMVERQQTYIQAVCKDIEQADIYLREIVGDMERDEWKPGGPVVDEIIVRSTDKLMGLFDTIGKLIRLIDADADLMYGEEEDDENGRYAYLYDVAFTELKQVIEQAC